MSTRDRRTAETSLGIRSEARRLTAERGLNGFTIEEVCSEVGIARRTFFNYFASKEHAVLGVPARIDLSELDDPFIARGPSSSMAVLIDDFVELLIARWEQMQLTAAEAEEIGRAFEREPQLVGHAIALAAQGQRHDTALIERRERMNAGDHRASTLVQVIGSLLRPAMDELFDPSRTADEEFRAIFLRRVRLVRELFSPA